MVSSNTLMLLVALTVAVVSSMGVHDASSTARMLAVVNATVGNITGYGWFSRTLEGGGQFAAWFGWLCFVEFGLVHLFTGAFVIRAAMQNDVSSAMTAIMGRLSPAEKSEMDEQTRHEWPNQSNRVVLQHGINIGWIGLWSIVMCVMIHYPPRMLWMLCMPLWLWSFAYWVSIDIPAVGGYLGEVQTYVCALGVLCAAIVAKNTYGSSQITLRTFDAEFGFTCFMPILLIIIACMRKIVNVVIARRAA